MIAKRFCKVFLKGSLIALMLLFTLSVAIAGPVTGAIFTTNFDGSFVNGNVYNSEFEPFLNGGPRPNAPCSAAGLPNGDYYFQVTDPSGAVLLSDYGHYNGVVSVASGVITSYSGSHYSSPDVGQCHATMVQLYPFGPTPNPGGEYKVWMTPVGSYKPGYGSFGFVPSSSKTDNFKVIPSEGECSEGCLP
jgi:hypothetical protein